VPGRGRSLQPTFTVYRNSIRYATPLAKHRVAIGQAAQTTGQQAAAAGESAATGAADAAAKTAKLTVTWETLGQVVMTQFIVRVLSQIRGVLRESVDEALKFSKSIAEIQTIAPKIDKDFRGLGKEVADFSQQFNFPLPDVAEAVYQTLSNQFTTASQRADVMTASAKLAKVGVMDLNEAVLLITGTLNGYGMQSSRAEDVAAKFFKTIELGRTRGAELTPVIGRIVPIASELGVTLDEVNSSMVALTIGSMRVPEAATSFRAGLAALIKPSTDLRKELRALGYETGQQMIHALGLQGTFEALRESQNDDVAATAALFRNIRALNAELRLTGAGAEQAEGALKAMSATSRDALNEAFKRFTSSDAQQYMKELNRFKVALATEVGPELIKFLSTLLKTMGGADGLTAAIKGLATTFTTLAEPLAVAAGAMLAFSLRAKLAAINATPLGSIFNNAIAPLAMTVWAADFLDQRLASVLGNANENFRKHVREIVEAQEKASTERIEAEKKVYDDAGRRLEQYTAQVRSAYNAQVDAAQKSNQELITSSRTTMQAMISARQRIVQQFRAAAQDANQAATDSAKRQADMQGHLDDLLFKEWLKRRQKYDAYYKKPEVTEDMYSRRALALAKEAAGLLAKAETPDQVRSAQALFQRAAAHVQEAQSIAEASKNERLLADAERTVEAIIRQQIAAEKEFQGSSASRAEAAAKAAAEEQRRVDRMKVLMKGILTDLDLFDKKGPIDPRKSAAMSADLKKKMEEFKGLWMAGTASLDLGEMLRYDALQQRVKTVLEGGVSDLEVQKLFAAPTTIDALRAQIEKGLGAVNVALTPFAKPGTSLTPQGLARMDPAARLAEMERLSAEYTKQVELVTKLQAEHDAIGRSMTLQKAAQGALGANVTVYRAALEDWRTFLSQATRKGIGTIFGGGNIREDTKALADLMQQFQQVSKTGIKGFGMDQFLELQKKATDLLTKPTLTALDREFTQSQMGWLKSLADQAETLKASQQTPQGQPRNVEAELQKARQEAERLKGIIDRLSPQTTTQMGEGAQQAQGALSAIPSMANLASDIQAAATAMWDLAAASWSVQAPPAAVTAAKGRTVWNFLAFGGPAQGTDVIPAMLSPGEVVINAASARKFASQLTAINAGVQPVYHSEGGSVTNIGDINATVTGGGTSRQTARSIAAELRRELRRGTATL
jgi:TP901 family phage tail tape measure protein